MRLACVRRAANVRSEPGSNSPVELESPMVLTSRLNEASGPLARLDWLESSRSPLTALNAAVSSRPTHRFVRTSFQRPSGLRALALVSLFFSQSHFHTLRTTSLRITVPNQERRALRRLSAPHCCRFLAGGRHLTHRHFAVNFFFLLRIGLRSIARGNPKPGSVTTCNSMSRARHRSG